jgi:glycerophosphoryl diester phosphodiesterase
MVVHDATLERLIDSAEALAALDASALKRLAYRSDGSRMLTLAELLELVAGREPVLVEIKSEWERPDARFLAAIAAQASAYKGPVGLMSFDPEVMATIKELAPEVPRGIVSGRFEGDGWWRERLGEERAFRLTHFLESRSAAPDFYAYDVKALPTPVTRFVREVLGKPLFTWTVRTPEDRKAAAQWADAPIFEGYEP